MRTVLANTCLAAAAAVVGLAAGGAFAQEVGPALSADELARVLAPAAAAVADAGRPRTRGLRPGGEVVAAAPAPGTAGSGVVPDLRLLFPYDSAELTPATRARLDELGRALKKDALKGYGFEIAGHTDAAGEDRYNMGLSRRRAEAVVGYLGKAHRVGKGRLESRGYGETALAVPAEPASARNRRVEVRTIR